MDELPRGPGGFGVSCGRCAVSGGSRKKIEKKKKRNHTEEKEQRRRSVAALRLRYKFTLLFRRFKVVYPAAKWPRTMRMG